jgi:MHS family alpha-ketoglutarate permease-like MFS transporter
MSPTSSAARTTATPRSTSRARNIISGSFGNFVEWYDWGIFGVLAAVFSSQIFHSGSDLASLLQTMVTFAVGFAARPLGAFFLSPLGDKLGRKRLLTLAITMMALGSLILALTPPYSWIGIASPIIFVIARLLQGVSGGAEYQSGASFIVEHSPEGKRGLVGSTALMSSIAGSLGATLTGTIVTTVFPADVLAAWGWRIPFLLGAGLGLVGLYLRSRVPETEVFEELKKDDEIQQSPVKEVFRDHKLTMLRVFAISSYTGVYYLWTVFLPTYSHLASGMPLPKLLAGSAVSLIIMFCALPLLGLLSDKIGRKPLLMTHSVLIILLGYPLLKLLEIPNFGLYMAIDIFGCLIVGLTSATQSTTYCEMTPPQIRTTAIGIPYNISSALIGGTIPLIATALVSAQAGAWLALVIGAIAAFSLIVVAFMPEVRGRSLTDPHEPVRHSRRPRFTS